MHIEMDGSDVIELLPAISIGIVVLIMLLFIVYFFVKKQDDNKKLEMRKVRVLEKTYQQGNLECYVVECENGDRLRLRSFQANNVMIAVGDVGIIRYKGQTIQSFERK